MSQIHHRKPRLALKLLSQALCAGWLLHAGGASALNLLQAYEAALQNDPTFQGARYDAAAGQENAILGRSTLLPNISASYSASRNLADIVDESGGIRRPSSPTYISRNQTVQLRQPVFNLEAWARYKQGKAQTEYSVAQFSLQGQDLVIRLAGAYFDTLLGDDSVALAQAQRDTLIEQKKVNDRIFEKGEGTRTDMLETQARLEVAEAALIEALDNQANAARTLAAITGVDGVAVDPVNPAFQMRPLTPGGFDEWKAIALANNPELQAQLAAVEASQQEVNKNRSGHAPRVDFIASYTKAASDTINTYNQESTVRSIGVQINIPLYSGGSVNASTRQAVAGREKTKTDLQVKTDKVLIELRKEYNMVLSSVNKITALTKAVGAGKLLVTATEQSIKGGVRINLDLLNAKQQMYATQRDLAQARYIYLMSLLRLRAAAGVLGGDDLRELMVYFR